MPLENMPGWVTAGGGGVLFYLAYKFFWPSVRDAMAGQATQWRSENKYIAQLEAALSRALQERDKAFQEKNELYQRFAKMEAQMQVMEHKLDQAYREVEKLTAQIEKLTGAIGETDNRGT